MYRKVWVVAILMTLLPLAFAEADEEADCFTYELDEEVEVCSEIKDQAKVGKTVRWTITVPSTEERTTLRLRNATPTVAKLRWKCADGIVRTSGGARNRARCKVKMIGPGTARLDAWPHVEDPQQKADLTALSLAKDLARCQRQFQMHRETLEATRHEHSGRRVYPSDYVEAVLARGERCALSALAGLWELVAMADWFEKIFGDAQQELQRIRTSAFLHSDDGSRVVLAVLDRESDRSRSALAHVGQRHLDADETKRVLDMLYELLGLATGKAEEKKLLIRELPVESCGEPGARFTLHPWSYRRDAQTKTLDDRFMNLYVGIYAYKLEKKGEEKGCYPEHEQHDSCSRINLMRNPPETLRCDFANGCRVSEKCGNLENGE